MLDRILYKFYKKRYIKYRQRVLTRQEIEFEDYSIRCKHKYICGLGDGFEECCFGEKCTKDFNKYGCMYLKGFKEY